MTPAPWSRPARPSRTSGPSPPHPTARATARPTPAATSACTAAGTDAQVTVRPELEWGADDRPGAPAARKDHGRPGQGRAGLDNMTEDGDEAEPGPWDQATWIPGGSLLASRGETQVQVDVSGASGKEADALALVRIAMPRFGHPLDYDGAKAVAAAPKPRAHPAHACDLVPRADVEAAIGPTDGSPASDSPETSCTWRVRTAQGERSYPVEMVWQGGAKNYQMLVHGMSMVGGLIGAPSELPARHHEAAAPDAAGDGRADEDGIRRRRRRWSGQRARRRRHVEARTDTTLKGPGPRGAPARHPADRRTRRRIRRMSLVSADYEKAKALMSAICSRL